MKINKKDFFDALKVTILASLLVVGVGYIYAWTGPSTNPPPADNVAAPINTSGNPQTKNALLTLGSLITHMGSYFAVDSTEDKVGIGTSDPVTKLQVMGITQADDFCLNSDTGKCLSNSGSGGTSGGELTYVAITPAKLLDCDSGLRNCTDSVGNRWIAVDLSGRWIPVSYPSAVPASARVIVVRFEAHQNGINGANGVIKTSIKADNMPEQVVSHMKYSNILSNNDDYNTVMVPYSNSRNLDIMMQINPATDAKAYVVGYLTSSGGESSGTEGGSWYILNASGDLVRKGNQTDPACDAGVNKDHPKCPAGMIMAGIDLCKPTVDVTKVAIWCVAK